MSSSPAAGVHPPAARRRPAGRACASPAAGRGLALLGLAVVAAVARPAASIACSRTNSAWCCASAPTATAPPPGLNWHLPWPIEHVAAARGHPHQPHRDRLPLRRRRQRRARPAASPADATCPSESLMLTGDENIIDINLAVFWRISNAADYLFNTRDPDNLVKAVAESSIREVIGRTPIQPALTQLRAQIETDVHTQTQQILDHYERRHRDHPGAVAEGRSAGRGDRELPRRAARQHRRRAHAQRGRGLPQRHRAARPRRRRPHRRRGPGRQAGRGRAGHRPGAAVRLRC